MYLESRDKTKFTNFYFLEVTVRNIFQLNINIEIIEINIQFKIKYLIKYNKF